MGTVFLIWGLIFSLKKIEGVERKFKAELFVFKKIFFGIFLKKTTHTLNVITHII
jgi:hypothetical protein